MAQQRLTKAAQREERRDRVMSLVLSGLSIRGIVHQTGISHGTVQRDIHARLKAAAAECPHTDQYRQIHQQRINQLFMSWWNRAQDDLAALDRVLRLLDREAKLLGLDAPAKQQITGPDGGLVQIAKPDLSELSTEDLEALREVARDQRARERGKAQMMSAIRHN